MSKYNHHYTTLNELHAKDIPLPRVKDIPPVPDMRWKYALVTPIGLYLHHPGHPEMNFGDYSNTLTRESHCDYTGHHIWLEPKLWRDKNKADLRDARNDACWHHYHTFKNILPHKSNFWQWRMNFCYRDGNMVDILRNLIEEDVS